MKSLFTLLLTIGSLTSVVAQNGKNDRYGRDDNNTAYDPRSNNAGYSKSKAGPDISDRNNDKRDYAYNERRYDGSFSMSYKEKEYQVQKINREYNMKINSVNRNRYLRSWERSSQIRNLERQRHEEIRNLEARFNDRRNRYSNGQSNRW